MSNIGTSTAFGTEWMVARIREIAPTSILDVGCGWGRWGLLAREFLELWAHRYRPEQWAVWIDAVDAHDGTWTPIHDFVYDRCFTQDIRDFIPDRDYGLILACDVVEHLPKADALMMLERFKAWAPHTLVGIPLGPGWLHPGVDGNPWEAHLSEWEAAEFGTVDAHLGHTEDGRNYRYGRFHL